MASGKDEIKAFDNDLYHYISHLQIALSGFSSATASSGRRAHTAGRRRHGGSRWQRECSPSQSLSRRYPCGFDTIGHLGLIYRYRDLYRWSASSLKDLASETSD